ncbi:MAG: helix-turn-helix domain-containing protein [Panacagrimonas sp.]
MMDLAIPAVDAYSEACRGRPSLVRNSPSRRVGLYGWRTGPTKEVHIAKTRELILSVHLGGARRVRVFTDKGLSHSFSKPGDITLIPSGQAVSYRTDGEVEFATLHFPLKSSAALDDRVSDTLSDLRVCLFALHDEYAVASVKTLMKASQASDPDSTQYSAALFDALSWHITRVVKESAAEKVQLGSVLPTAIKGPNFEEVARQIEMRLADKLTLQDLADVAGVSRSTFAERFTQRFGCSPHRFITQRRIERAKALLQEGRLSVADIAYELGFSGQSHFSTTFRALTGYVPTAFSDISQAEQES